MAYTEHRAFAALPNSGAYDDTLEAFRLPAGSRRVGIRLRYKPGAGATGGFPGLRLWWSLAGITGETLATVRNGTLVVSGAEGRFSEYQGILYARDLTDAAGADGLATIRSIDVEPGAYALRVEPFEAGDAAHPGELEIMLEGAL